MKSLAFAVSCALALTAAAPASRVTWEDLAPLHGQLTAQGITRETLPSRVERIREDHLRRMREGDLDHLVFYLLQSTRFTTLPRIEPALSARALVSSLEPGEREEFVRDPSTATPRVAPAVRARIAALLRAVDTGSADPRLEYFRSLLLSVWPGRDGRDAAIAREYLRVMRFVYEKEFVAQGAGTGVVAGLYRQRGLSTDTAVEAGFLVYQGLGIVRALDPEQRVRRVLIVGPGLDLAPRTALHESGPPQSYQPWAVIDALVAIGLSRAGDLEVVAGDINPRVVEHLDRARRRPPELTLASEIREVEGITLTPEYREYFAQLGTAIGVARPRTGANGDGRLRKTVRVRPEVAAVVRAERLDVVTERLTAAPFDLIVATNILPYFDNLELMLAMTNIAGMLAPRGVFVHNEARPILHELTTALGLPLEQSRHAVIASVDGAAAPLLDSVWVHRKSAPALR